MSDEPNAPVPAQEQGAVILPAADVEAEALAADIVKGKRGAASLSVDPAASVALRARAIAADALVTEAQAIVDAPLLCESSEMSAEGARAERRAKYRWDRAKALYRAVYGDAVKLDAQVQMLAVVAFRGLAQRAGVDEE